MHTPTPPGPVTLRLRDTQLRLYAGLQGLDTEAAIAAAAGLDRSTVNRLLHRQLAPGPRVIAAILTAFPERRFDDFFEIAPGAVPAAA